MPLDEAVAFMVVVGVLSVLVVSTGMGAWMLVKHALRLLGWR